MHRKRMNIAWVTYYCPNKNRKERLRYDAADFCPICGQRFEWKEPAELGRNSGTMRTNR